MAKENKSTNTVRALKDIYINGGTILVKKGETFESSCKACIKNMIANKMVELVNPE